MAGIDLMWILLQCTITLRDFFFCSWEISHVELQMSNVIKNIVAEHNNTEKCGEWRKNYPCKSVIG